jgi:phosphate uptake regulator
MAFGNSSFIVSVPKAWVEKNRLKKGDTLMVEEKPNELILSSSDNSERKKVNETSISAEGKSAEELKTEITSFYINNFDIITVIKAKDNDQVKEMLRSLVGMEIVEETTSKVVAKDLLDIKEVSLDNIIRRIDIITRSMLIDASELDDKNAESVYSRDKEVNRLSLLGFRTAKAATDNPRLLKLFNTTYWDVMLAKQVITSLERFADQIKRILRVPQKGFDKATKDEFITLLKHINDNYLKVMKLYYEQKKDATFKAETETRALLKDCNAILQKHPSIEVVRVIELVKYMIVSMTGILRTIMEKEHS